MFALFAGRLGLGTLDPFRTFDGPGGLVRESFGIPTSDRFGHTCVVSPRSGIASFAFQLLAGVNMSFFWQGLFVGRLVLRTSSRLRAFRTVFGQHALLSLQPSRHHAHRTRSLRRATLLSSDVARRGWRSNYPDFRTSFQGTSCREIANR